MDRRVRVTTVQPTAELAFDPLAEDLEAEIARAIPRAELAIANVAGLLTKAGKIGSDLVCLPEWASFAPLNVCYFKDVADFNVSLAGPLYERAISTYGGIAKAYRMYVVASVLEPSGDRLYNCGILIGRDGSIMGKYHKSHVPACERWAVSAGEGDFPVFESDFGRLGILICYDMMFPEPAEILALKGADLICYPTIGFEFRGEELGEIRLRARALDNNIYVVCSNYATGKKTRVARSCIVDPHGYVIADSGNEPNTISTALVDLNREVRVINDVDVLGSGIRDWRVRMIKDRRPETYGVLTDPWPPRAEEYRHVSYRTPEEVRRLYKHFCEVILNQAPASAHHDLQAIEAALLSLQLED